MVIAWNGSLKKLNNMNRNNYFILFAILILVSAVRFFPHLPNFAPITALAIFAGANLSFKKAAGLTLASRFISDLFLGFFSWPQMLAVYACHLVAAGFGILLKNKVISKNWFKVFGVSILSSILFFLVTNFAFLYAEYPHNFLGVIEAYTNGIPFLKGTVLGDLFYTTVFFGAFEAVKYFELKKHFVEIKVRA